jgi:hypothetical protein
MCVHTHTFFKQKKTPTDAASRSSIIHGGV